MSNSSSMATTNTEQQQHKKRKLDEKSSTPNGKKKKQQIPTQIDADMKEEDFVDPFDIASESEIHSSTKAKMMFQWLIAPVTVEDFYAHYWERKPLVIKRKSPDYYKGWFSVEEIDRILKEHSLTYGEDIDITKYENNTRHTLNPEGAATDKIVWKHFSEGCSVRLLCPQQYCDALWKLMSILEEEWGCMAGSNTYLTPKGSQGFAPHYDDIEAFLIQVEGAKHWKVYSPLSEESILPRYSSGNFAQNEIGSPVLEVTLEQGDLLYFPRGFIHQAVSPKEVDSLHVTLSTGQQNTWGNLLEVLLPQAVGSVISQNIDIRRSLPRNYLDYQGVIHSDKDDERRKEFSVSLKKQLRMVVAEAMEMSDAACDQMARNFLVDRLPICLEDSEEGCTVEGSPLPKISVNTRLRLIRHNIVRMTIESGKAVIYHCLDNSRKHHETPLSPMEFELDDAESIEFILQSYPNYFRVGDLPHEDCDDQVGLVKALYDEGLLMFETKN